MLLDKLTQLADGWAPTTNTTTYTSYSYDCGDVTPKREIGTGEPLALVFTVGAAATGATDTTVLGACSATSGTDLSADVLILASRLIPNASLTTGSVHVVPIPPGSVTQRYIGGYVTLGTGDAITLDVNIVPMSLIGITKAYADAVTWT